MKRQILFSTDSDDSIAMDPDRVATMIRMLDTWRDPVRPANRKTMVEGQDYEPQAIGRIKGNLFSANDVRVMERYVRNLLRRGREWISQQRVIETSPQAVFMMDQAETHFQMIERMLIDYVEEFQRAERQERLGDLPGCNFLESAA